MNISVVDFECVGFVGFYEGVFDVGENLWNTLREDESYTFGIPRNSLEEDEDYKFDYNNYRKNICEGWVKVMNRYIRDELGIDCELVFTGMTSPRDYNYGNDRLFCGFKCRHFKWVMNHKVLPLMRENKEVLTELIHDNHTSYDGFTSYMSNDFDEWYAYLANSKNYRDDEFFLYFSHIITYLIAVSKYEYDYGSKFVFGLVQEVYEDYESIYENIEYLLTAEELIAKYGSAE